VAKSQSLELVYDTGALIAAERNDRRFWAIHARALQRNLRPIVPAGCLVELWHEGRNLRVTQLLDGCEVEPLGEPAAKCAGALRQRMSDPAGPIDAMVVELAIRRPAAVVTSDRGDIERIADASHRKLQVIDV
jgi:predicted nucleic acid-binding protein